MNTPPVPDYHIRTIERPEELAVVVELQRSVWPGPDSEFVPAHLLLTAAHNGGLVAGAWVGERLIGFVFGFLGLHEHRGARRLKHCSHMLGVHPDYRNAGVGFALKCYQRNHVLRQGLDHITWTYDPLLARNAHLNIARLGAICNTYLVNLYGDLADGLNTGLPTDRFQVDWWIATPQMANRLAGTALQPGSLADRVAAGALLINPPGLDGVPRPPVSSADVFGIDATVLVEIPANFQALKAADPTLALRWRTATRQTFEALFVSRFTVTDFVSQVSPGPRAAYVLTHEDRAQ